MKKTIEQEIKNVLSVHIRLKGSDNPNGLTEAMADYVRLKMDALGEYLKHIDLAEPNNDCLNDLLGDEYGDVIDAAVARAKGEHDQPND